MTNNVYAAMRHILETYDGLTWADDVDAATLSADRGAWHCGRSLTEQRSSRDYLRELAAASFCCIFPTRSGKRGIRAFLDHRTPTVTHGEADVLSVHSFDTTDLAEVYNDLRVQYAWNPGAGRFDEALFLSGVGPGATFPAPSVSTGTDAVKAGMAELKITGHSYGISGQHTDYYYGYATFADCSWASDGAYIYYDSGAGQAVRFAEIMVAGSTILYFRVPAQRAVDIAVNSIFTSGTFTLLGSSVPLWSTLAGGYDSDYAAAKADWEICQDSYNLTRRVTALPKAMAEGYWYPSIDTRFFNYPSGAMAYFRYLTSWITRQHEVVSYSVPITAANLQIELCAVVSFTDAVFTNGAARTGIVRKVKIAPAQAEMVLELVLIPEDLETIDLIIETGDAADTITESGSQADTVTEGA